MTRRVRWGWVPFALAVAALIVWVTYAVSAGVSCGAYDSGPNPGAEEDWCGYGAGELGGFRLAFVLVQFIPAIPVLIGGYLAASGRSQLFVPAGVVTGVLCSLLIWSLEP